MNSSRKTTSILILLGIAVMSASAGCGQAPGQPLVGTATADSTNSAGEPSGNGGSTTFGNGSPNYDYHFEVTGQGTATQVGGGALTVTTDTLLQVSLTAGEGMAFANSGFNVGFNCEWFNVKVGNVSQPAAVRMASYSDFFFQYTGVDPCANLPTTWNYDFSSALGVQHTGGINIIVNSAQYDSCRNQNYTSQLVGKDYGGCGKSSVYYSDSIDGYLQVFTD